MERNSLFISSSLAPLVIIWILVIVIGAAEEDERLILSASRLEMFVDEVPDMPKIRGFEVVHGVPVSKSLTIGMFQKKWKFHRDLPPALVFAFGTSADTATVPGPTIEAIYRTETYVTWENHLPSKHILPVDLSFPTATPKTGIPTVVHVHGGIHEPQSDGHPESWFTAGFQEKGPTWTKPNYHYPNFQNPGTLWYHDHTMGLTRVNLLAGLLGAYIIRQPDVEGPLGLPDGDEFDRTLIICDRSFYTDGSIYLNSTGNNPFLHPHWQPEYFGNIVLVNGKVWPHMIVQRKKYRFRIINASNARLFKFYFTNGLKFTYVASDSAYLERPIELQDFLMSSSETADVVVDFSESESDVAILANNAPYPKPVGVPVMKFIIRPDPVADMHRIPAELVKYPSPNLSGVSITRYITMYEYKSSDNEPTRYDIDQRAYEDPVTETPKEGATEIWYVINLTEDDHPFHVHLSMFVVLDQKKLDNVDELKECMMRLNDAIKCQISNHTSSKGYKVPVYSKGWKSVYKVRPGYITKFAMQFSYIHSDAPYPFDSTVEPGYVYHCHILDHEDNVMMRPLKFISSEGGGPRESGNRQGMAAKYTWPN